MEFHSERSHVQPMTPRVWKVKFAPGTLRAVARNKGRQVATYEVRAAGTPAKILLSADRKSVTSSWYDVIVVTATVVDANGVLVPTASDQITFNVTGPGVVAAVDSGNNRSYEAFQAKERKAYQGRCYAMLKATGGHGRISLVASAPG